MILRRALYVIAPALAAVTLICLVDSLAWIDRPFMGFLLGRNRVVAPIGLSGWTGFKAEVPFGAVLVEADGRPVDSVPRLIEETWTKQPGTPVRYGFATTVGRVERVVPVMVFTLADHLGLFGVWLLNGSLFLILGVLVARLKPGYAASAAMLVFSSAWGLTLLLSLGDFYRFHFRSLYAVAQAVSPAALIVLALTFPDRPLPRRQAPLFIALAALTTVHAGLDIWLYERAPHAWMVFFGASLVYMALAALVACGLLLSWYRIAPIDGRTRAKLVGLAALIAFGVPAVIHLSARLGGHSLPINLLPITTALFPLVIAYAVVKHDLLDLDPLLTRSVFYVVLTTAATAGYLLLPGLARALGPGSEQERSSWASFLFTLSAVVIVAPLRSGVQSVLDRFFFRTQYDLEGTIESVSRTLAASVDRRDIAEVIRGTLLQTIAPSPCLVLLPEHDGRFRDAGGFWVAPGDPLFASGSGPGAMILPVDPNQSREAHRLAALGVTVVVLLWLEDRLEGLLAIGPKQSGAPYGARDLGLLRTVGNQAAMALRNAESYTAIRELTTMLEAKVAERTRDLARTHETLLATRDHLARADKLASLGRLVAGIAHEINNPVAFINASVDLIHDSALQLTRSLGGTLSDGSLRNLERLVQNAAICREGAARAARIVRELTAFSRASDGKRQPIDVHSALERTLQLLHGECRDRIRITRKYGNIPQPSCDPGQIDQIFMNLLTNAVQAIDGEGEIEIRTSADNGSVFIEVSDSGPGVPPDMEGRIFEPFFTTKPAGQGTGLGLAIAHSLAVRHGGEIRVARTPHRGATFVVRLPANGQAIAEAS